MASCSDFSDTFSVHFWRLIYLKLNCLELQAIYVAVEISPDEYFSRTFIVCFYYCPPPQKKNHVGWSFSKCCHTVEMILHFYNNLFLLEIKWGFFFWLSQILSEHLLLIYKETSYNTVKGGKNNKWFKIQHYCLECYAKFCMQRGIGYSLLTHL